MRFCLLDAALEQGDDRIVTIKHVCAAEEYLRDHFPEFPVLPGVLMLEAMVQAGRRLVERRRPASAPPMVLGSVRSVKYGRFVQPGDTLRIEVDLLKSTPDGSCDFRGEGTVLPPGAGPEQHTAAVSGRFSLRPARPGG